MYNRNYSRKADVSKLDFKDYKVMLNHVEFEQSISLPSTTIYTLCPYHGSYFRAQSLPWEALNHLSIR